MGWVPANGWLTKVGIDAAAPQLSFDLAIDASGRRRAVAGHGRAGPARGAVVAPDHARPTCVRLLVGIALTVGGIGGIVLLGPRRRPPLSMA